MVIRKPGNPGNSPASGHRKTLLRLLLWAIAVAALSPPAAAQSAPVILDDTRKALYLGTHVEYLEDAGRKLALTDIVQKKGPSWHPSSGRALNFGFTRSAYWFRFTLDNGQPRSQNWYLELNFPHLNQIDMFIPQPDGTYHSRKAGIRYPFAERPLPDKNFVFPLTPPPGKTTYYLRITADYPLIFDPLLQSPDTYRNKFSRVYPLYWFLYGALLIMILYNLIFYSLVRIITRLYLVLFILLFALLQFTIDGFGFQILWPEAVAWAGIAPLFFLCLMIGSMIIYIRDFISLPQLLDKKYDQLWMYSVILPNLLWPIILVPLGIGHAAICITGALVIYAVLAVGGVGLLCVLQGKTTRAVRFTWINFSPLAIGAALGISYYMGLLPPNFFTIWSIHIGIALFIALLSSVGMADKLTNMRKELLINNTHISLMLESISQKTGDEADNLEKYHEEKIGAVMQTRFQNFLEKFKALVHEIRDKAALLNASAGSLSALSGKMNTETDNIAMKADGVAAASEEMSARMNTISGTIEQANQNTGRIVPLTETMTASIDTIIGGTASARRTTAEAVSQSEKVSRQVNQLRGAAEKIELVTETITAISKKTNLLALNATIEAARAGQAGQGFAMVAADIKNLARRTAAATSQINQQIEENQTVTGEVVIEIRQIVETIHKIDEIVSTIASAVEEQSAATREITGNITEVSQGISETSQHVAECSRVTGSVSRDVSVLSESSRKMSGNSREIKESAAELTRMADHLTALIEKFQL